MRSVAKLPAKDLRALFTNTAGKTGMTDAIIEKDFWVCWTLDYLFNRCKWRENLVLKGGTSLSDVY
jgi:predicted nucleotidyltransferase component of viral defense system